MLLFAWLLCRRRWRPTRAPSRRSVRRHRLSGLISPHNGPRCRYHSLRLVSRSPWRSLQPPSPRQHLRRLVLWLLSKRTIVPWDYATSATLGGVRITSAHRKSCMRSKLFGNRWTLMLCRLQKHLMINQLNKCFWPSPSQPCLGYLLLVLSGCWDRRQVFQCIFWWIQGAPLHLSVTLRLLSYITQIQFLCLAVCKLLVVVCCRAPCCFAKFRRQLAHVPFALIFACCLWVTSTPFWAWIG